MNRLWYIARAVLLGLLITQVLATLHVCLSNLVLYDTVTAIRQEGYLAIPNVLLSPSLKEFGPAFFGGCFFTLSLGAGLSLFSVIIAWFWDRIFARNRTTLVPMVFLWLALVVALNRRGFSPMVTAYFLAVPLAVFVAALKWMPQETGKKIWSNRLIPVVPIAVLTLLWTANADRFLFLDIRDFLLLSNPVGQKVDDFYYRYTLYPAQVFKTLEQKTLRTCRVVFPDDTAHARRLRALLAGYDYLPIGSSGPVDLEIAGAGDRLDLKHHGKTVLQTTMNDFLTRPGGVLKDFSAQTDRHGLFRQATVICLLLGFPILLYVMVFALIHLVSGFFMAPGRSSVTAATLCFALGLALLVPLRIGRPEPVSPGLVAGALNSPLWQQRVSGLRIVVEEKMEIGNFPAYRQMLSSPHIAERYWLAKAFGLSRRPETYQGLLLLLDDPYPDVVSMAFYALGQRGDRRAVGEILTRIKTSGHWYNQWYAYRALKALGWRQTKQPRRGILDTCLP